MRSTLVISILSFITFLTAKFGVGYLAIGNCEPWTTIYYVMIGISLVLAFIAISLLFSGWKRNLLDGMVGFFIGEVINQYYHDGTYSLSDIAFYTATPVVFYIGSKYLNK